MKADLEFTYPTVIEIALKFPFQGQHVVTTFIFTQTDLRSCTVGFHFGASRKAVDWPEGVDKVSLNLRTESQRHTNLRSLYTCTFKRENGNGPHKICEEQNGSLFDDIALYLANLRCSRCPVELDIIFNQEKK